LPCSPRPPSHRGNIVIFAITTDADGKVTNVEVSRVIDPRKGTAPVKIELEAEWPAAVRARIETRDYPHEAKTFYAYYPYEPFVPLSPL
jgi:hypothetical protein